MTARLKTTATGRAGPTAESMSEELGNRSVGIPAWSGKRLLFVTATAWASSRPSAAGSRERGVETASPRLSVPTSPRVKSRPWQASPLRKRRCGRKSEPQRHSGCLHGRDRRAVTMKLRRVIA